MLDIFGGMAIFLLSLLLGLIWRRRLRKGKGRVPRVLDPVLIEDAQFTVFRPQFVNPETWYTLLAFAHRSKAERPGEPDPVDEVARQATHILGDSREDYQTISGDSSQPIPREGEITIVPDVQGIEFNPKQRTFRWTESVHREEFRFRADSALDGQTVRGRLSAYLGVVLIADVVLAIRVDSTASAEADTTKAGSASPYRKIFASYSRKDLPVVLQVEKLASSLGDSYLRDLTALRAGELWNEGLKKMILEADVFQLFWSWNSMGSPYVRQEWEYALSLGRESFVRPNYWEEPMPRQPGLPSAELQTLHFHFLAIEQEETPAIESERYLAHPEVRATPERARGRNLLVAGLTSLLVVGLVGTFSVVQIYSGAENPVTVTADDPLVIVEEPASWEVEIGELPQLVDSDAWLREVVAQISDHPVLAEWLVTDEMIRRFVATVDNLAEGASPSSHLSFMDPGERFMVEVKGGRYFIDPASYERYDIAVEAVTSIDSQEAAQWYRALLPLFREAYAELGYLGEQFDEAVRKAMERVVATPVLDNPIELEPSASTYRFKDPVLESLSPAERQLLRLGPDNLRRLQAKVVELAYYLAIDLGAEAYP